MKQPLILLVHAQCDRAFVAELAGKLESIGIVTETSVLEDSIENRQPHAADAIAVVLSQPALGAVSEHRLCSIASAPVPVLPVVVGEGPLPSCFAGSPQAVFDNESTYWLGVQAILNHLKSPAAGRRAPLGVPSPCPVDAGGRLFLPSHIYGALVGDSRGSVLTVSVTQRCLKMYSFQRWRELEDDLARLPTFDRQSQTLRFILIGHAVEEELGPDRSVVIPPCLREWASIGDQAVLVCLGNAVEMWGLERFSAVLRDSGSRSLSGGAEDGLEPRARIAG